MTDARCNTFKAFSIKWVLPFRFAILQIVTLYPILHQKVPAAVVRHGRSVLYCVTAHALPDPNHHSMHLPQAVQRNPKDLERRGKACRNFIGIHRHVFRSTICFDSSSLYLSCGRCHDRRFSGDRNFEYRHRKAQNFNSHRNWRNGLIGNQGRQLCAICMARVQTSYFSVVFHAKIKIPTIGIGECYHSIYDIPIRQTGSIAFELMRQVFFEANVLHRITSQNAL